LVDHGVQIGTEPISIDPGCLHNGLGDDRPWHEPARLNRPEFGNRHPIARHDDGLPRLHFSEHGRGVIAKLALRDDSAHECRL
jgi:hypothetical protein